jgi:predicted nucleic acid-binding Zn ribbon protein
MQQDPDFDEVDFENAQHLVQKRQRFSRRPKKTADLLSQLFARQGYGQSQSVNELDEAWEIAAGPKFHNKTKAGKMNRGVLEVYVTSSAAIQQLGFQKKQLLSAMQQQLPQNKIKDLRFKLGNVAR